MAIKEENKNRLVNLGALDKVAKKLKEAANQAAADAANEANRAQGEEQRIEGKVDVNAAAIAKLNGDANTEGSVAKAVAAEASRAATEEGKLDDRLKAIEGIVSGDAEVTLGDIIADVAENAEAIEILNGDATTEGSVAKVVADAVKAEADRAKEVEGDLDGRIAAVELVVGESGKLAEVEGKADENAEAIAVLNGGVNVEGSVANAVKVAQDAADAAQDAADAAQADVDAVEERLDAEGGLVDRIEANEADIARLDGAVDVEGSVKKQIKDAINEVNGAAGALADRVEAVENFRDVTYPAAEAKVREDFAAADGVALQAAKDYADQQITALVDSAPDAMNTLNELAEAIKGNEDIYKAYVQEHAQAMAQMKSELQAEIDTDVAAEAGLRESAVASLQEAVNAKVAQSDYDTKIAALEAKDAELEKAIGDNKTAQGLINDDFEERIAENEAFVAAQPNIDKAQDDRLDALEAKFEGDETVKQQIAGALQDAKDYADEKAEEVQGNVDELANVVGKEAEGEAPATGIFAKLVAMQADIDQNEADCDKAIADEIAARNQAITDALAAYSNTEAVKLMLGNVVSTLNLSVEENKVVLKLGGAEGVELTSTSLNMADDEDINAIIADLG